MTMTSSVEAIGCIESDLKHIIGEISRCRIGRIKASTNVRDDLGIDSFTALEILVAIEHKYTLKIAEIEISELLTFGNLVDFVYHKLNQNLRNS